MTLAVSRAMAWSRTLRSGSSVGLAVAIVLLSGPARAAPPSGGTAGATTEQAEAARAAVRGLYREQELGLSGPGAQPRIWRGPRRTRVGEADLARLARQEALAEEIQSREWRAKRNWLFTGAGVAAVGLGVVVGATLVADSALPGHGECYYAPCAVAWDHDIYIARYREVVEQRQDERSMKVALLLSGATIMAVGATIIGVATQATGGPHLSDDRARELVDAHNRALAERLGYDTAPSAPPPPVTPPAGTPASPPDTPAPSPEPAAPPASAPAPSSPAGPQWMLLPVDAPALGMALGLRF